MNSFRNGNWHFRAGIEPSGKRFEVLYYDAQYRRKGVQRFHDRGAADAFAAKHGGEVKEIQARPFRLQEAR